MKQFLCSTFLIVLIVSQFGVTKTVGAENTCQDIPNIFISEIAWAGSSKSATDEWLEIANGGEETIDLSGWTIEGAATNNGKLTLPEGSQILSRNVYLVANYSAENSNSTLNSPPNYVTTSVSLSNSSLSIILKNKTGCLIDSAGNGKTPFFGGTSTTGTVSMVRYQPTSDGTLESSWLAAESSDGFDSGTPDLGTPGTIEGEEGVEEDETVSETPSDPTEESPPSVSTEIIELIIITTTDLTEEISTTSINEPTAENVSVVSENNKASSVEEIVTSETIDSPEPNENIVSAETENNTEVIDSDVVPTIELVETTTDVTTVEETEVVETLLFNSVQDLQGTSETEETIEAPTTTETTMGTIVVTETTTPETTEESEATTEETETMETTETVLAETATTVEITETAVTETTVSYPQGTLIINEFVSDPVSGEKEWVEILNPYNNVIPLDGWQISESSGRKISLPDIELGFNQTAAAEFSSGALNNDGDVITLLDPTGETINQIQYGTAGIPAASDPNSVARKDDGTFVVTTTSTKGATNIITVIETTVENTDTATVDEEIVATTNDSETTTAEDSTADEEVAVDIDSSDTTETEITIPPTVRLSELYPNTGGSDTTEEFIELENFGTSEVDLFGLKLEDAAENHWEFADHTTLAAGGFLTVKRPEFQFALNNSGSETVRLYSADGSLLDETQYENAPKKIAFAYDGTSWRWTSNFTPNEPNAFPEAVATENSSVVEDNGTVVSGQRTDETKSVARVSIAEARALGPDKKIIIDGIVTVKPGILSTQIFYITDNESGIQIYKSDGNFPDLEIGERIEISGTTSSNRQEPRIKIGKTDTIIILEENVPLSITETEKIDESLAGRLVKASGIIAEKSSEKLTLEIASSMIEIKIKKDTAIELTDIKIGDRISITGVVGQTEENFYLLPRSPDDLVKVENPEEALATTETTEPTGKTVAKNTSERNAIIIGAAVILGLAAYAFNKRKQAQKKIYEKNRKLSLAPTG